MIGWVSSGKYLYNHSNLENLKDSIKAGLGINDISQIFQASQKLLKHHVYSLLSFTDQANTEFLIGAKRVIGPRLFSAAMVVLGEYNLPIIVTAVTFIFIAVGITFVIDNLGQFKQFRLSQLPACVLIILIACNFAFQNPLNEGGLGQIFVFPSLCLLISAYLKNIFILESIVIYLLSARLLYAESGSQLLLLISIIMIFERIPYKLREVSVRKRIYLFSLIFVILSTVLSYILEVINLTKTLSAGSGGWGIGNVITPLNFGLINYVNDDGKSSPSQLFPTILFLILIAIAVLIAIKSISIQLVLISKEFKLIIGLLLTWVYLFYLTWETGNNYSIWKFASTASVFVFIIASIELSHCQKQRINHITN